MLLVKPLVTNSKGQSIFKEVEYFFQEKEILLSNIIACATCGAHATVGQHRGFLHTLKAGFLNFLLFTASFIEDIWSLNILVRACMTH